MSETHRTRLGRIGMFVLCSFGSPYRTPQSAIASNVDSVSLFQFKQFTVKFKLKSWRRVSFKARLHERKKKERLGQIFYVLTILGPFQFYPFHSKKGP